MAATLLRAGKIYSPGQFALFRMVFGLVMFVLSVVVIFLEPVAPPFLVAAGVALSGVLISLGWQRRWAALGSAACLVALWQRWGNFELSPLLLVLLPLLVAMVPDGEPWRRSRRTIQPSRWRMPAGVYWSAWIILTTTYVLGGVDALFGPIFDHVTHPWTINPLEGATLIPDWYVDGSERVSKILFWSVALWQIGFLPLSFHRKTRGLAWLGLLALNLVIVVFGEVDGLSLPLLLLHLFVFDPEWLPAKTPAGRTPLLLYDGKCGLCNAVVRFLLREDAAGALRFATLQGLVGQAALRARGLDTTDFDSLVFIPDYRRDGKLSPSAPDYYLRTEAVARILAQLGGLWRVLSWAWVIPARWRDPAYRLVARLRYRFFGAYRPTPLPEPGWAERFL